MSPKHLLSCACLAVAGSLASVASVEAVDFSSGTFSTNLVLELAGLPDYELYGVSFGTAPGNVTSLVDGYMFSADPLYGGDAPVTYDSYWYRGYMGNDSTPYVLGPDGATTGDSDFDNLLNTGCYGGNGQLTLGGLTIGSVYSVLFLNVDNRTGMSDRFFQITNGETSISQQYSFSGQTGNIGGYILASFTATATTEVFQINADGANQLGAILVTEAVPEPATYALMLGGIGLLAGYRRFRFSQLS